MNDTQHYQREWARPRRWRGLARRLMLGVCVCACAGAPAWGEEPAVLSPASPSAPGSSSVSASASTSAPASSSVSPSASSSASAPRLVGTATVFRYGKADPYDRTNLYGFNHAPSVTLLADGRLLAAWFSGPYEASVHQVILGSFSDDGGRSWSPAQVLQDDPRRSDFDPAFLADGNRTWLCFSVGRWNRYPFVGLRDAEKREVGVDSFRLMMRVSEDAGATWSDAVQVLPETGWGPRSNGIQLASGELVLPIYRFKRPRIAALLCSRDGGATWQRLGTVEGPGGMDVVEPSVAQVPSGKLLMVLRTADGRLWMASSENRGQTWSAPVDTGLIAAQSSHNLLCTSRGLLVLTHNPSAPPLRTPLTMRVSADEGRTWGPPLTIAQVTPPAPDDPVWGRQVSYPSVAELPDGTLVVVWTDLVLSNDHQSGVIRAARVQLDESAHPEHQESTQSN